MSEKEIRILTVSGIEIRAKGDAQSIRGYAAKFNVMSENLGGFRETIKPGAFSDVLSNDVRALVNHEDSMVLARTASKTLAIGEDDEGLWYECSMPDTSYARDLIVSLKRGDVTQSSFAFTVASGGDQWDEDEETGAYVRTINKIGRLYDVSPVTYPAYPDATVGLRSLGAVKAGREAALEEKRKQYRARKQREMDMAIRGISQKV